MSLPITSTLKSGVNRTSCNESALKNGGMVFRNASAVRRAGHCAIVSPREPEKILLYGGSSPDDGYTESTPELAIFDTKT